MTQHQAITDYLNTHGTITPMQAFRDLGITKLSTRISELRKKGVVIEKSEVKATNRNGKSIRYMRYSLPKS